MTGMMLRTVLSFAFMVVMLLIFNAFTNWVELRPGATLNDPILNLFQPRDFTFFIFAGIYVSIVFGFFFHRKNKQMLSHLFVAYGLLIGFRIISMYLIALDPPATMIPLRDPFVELFGSDGRLLTRDLFFSGHTSLAFLIAFSYQKSKLQKWFFLNAFAIASLLLLQHVHYSIDIWVAPFFAWASLQISKKIIS